MAVVADRDFVTVVGEGDADGGSVGGHGGGDEFIQGVGGG